MAAVERAEGRRVSEGRKKGGKMTNLKKKPDYALYTLARIEVSVFAENNAIATVV